MCSILAPLSKIILFILFFAIVITRTYAQEQISSKDAKDYIGKTIQVNGKVVSIYISQKGNVFINFDEKSPNQTFTVAMMSGTDIDISKIKEGCILTVYGEIKEYKDKPEIMLERNDQIINIE